LEQQIVFCKGSQAMVVRCEEVWREVSNYLDGEVTPDLRAAIEEHVRGCKHCTAVLDGTRNVVQLYGDERMVEVPLGFSYRLHRRLEDNMPGSRRSFLGWMVAAAAAVVLAGGFEAARSTGFEELRSEHARSGNSVPPDMLVFVYDDGKTFHVAGCPFIHDKAHLRTIAARDAMQQGYAACTRCMKKYLTASLSAAPGPTGVKPRPLS
jgi:putative zinc finger protein